MNKLKKKDSLEYYSLQRDVLERFGKASKIEKNKVSKFLQKKKE